MPITLTDRQYEVAVLAAKGMTYADIARHLGISKRTVRNHLQDITRRVYGDGPRPYKIAVLLANRMHEIQRRD